MWNVSQHTQLFSPGRGHLTFLLDSTRSKKCKGEERSCFNEFFNEHHFEDKTNRVDQLLGRVLLGELVEPGNTRILVF